MISKFQSSTRGLIALSALAMGMGICQEVLCMRIFPCKDLSLGMGSPIHKTWCNLVFWWCAYKSDGSHVYHDLCQNEWLGNVPYRGIPCTHSWTHSLLNSNFPRTTFSTTGLAMGCSSSFHKPQETTRTLVEVANFWWRKIMHWMIL